jgi:hypothetical protein
MAIDTQDKRSSVIGHGIGCLTVFPSPNAGISKDDRRHQSSFYRGIDTAIVARFRWISEGNSSEFYKCETNSSSNYECEGSSSIDCLEMKDMDDNSSNYECEGSSSIDCLEMKDMDEG